MRRLRKADDSSQLLCPMVSLWIQLEAIAIRLEAIASRLEAIAIRLIVVIALI